MASAWPDDEVPMDLRGALFAIAALDWQLEDGRAADLDEGVEAFGSFEGLPPKVALLDDGRMVRLLAPLSYTSAEGLAWPVPAGVLLDGASIPRAFWSLVGGPFEGRYRNASIVHDHYCDIRTRSWQATHRVFHLAMRCSGVPEAKAAILYYAVRRFGPRWPSDVEELVELPGTAMPAPPSDADAATLLADAQAICVHRLGLDAIDALADARDRSAGAEMLEGVGGGDPERARRLVVVGGSGTPEDLEAVAREAALLPSFVLERFERQLIRILACRDNVTDFETDLKGQVPRGWESTGRTWDTVPGTYFQDRKRVVIATVAGPGGRAVPGPESGRHGSINLVLHESLHGYDYSGEHAVIREAGFLGAYESDKPRLGAYERQDGEAGREEAFAESGARYCVAPEAMRAALPALFAYWDAGPRSATETVVAPEMASATAALGTVTARADGGLSLDLRAEGPGGAIGHAAFEIPAGDARQGDLREGLLREALAGETAHESVGGSAAARAGGGDGRPVLVPAPSPAATGQSNRAPGRPGPRLIQGRHSMDGGNPRTFIESAPLAEMDIREAALAVEPLNLDKLPNGVVSGTTLLDFSAVPSPAVRAGVSLSMLFASRVATAAMGPDDDEEDWLAAYTSNLGNLGFSVAGFSTVASRFKKTGLDVHKAIIPFLTVAFGGAAIGPIILAALKNLQEKDASSPWITLFDQESRRFAARELHFAAVSSSEADTSIRYAIARLNVDQRVTNVLFFKLGKTEADFESSTTTMSANNSLLAVTEPDLRARLGDMTTSFIKEAKLK